MNYIEYDFSVRPRDPFTEILLAELSQLGFESFVETDNGLKAYMRKDLWNSGILDNIDVLDMEMCTVSVSKKEIKQENWNAKWESDFKPIVVEDRCTVRASFHEVPNTEFDIIIDPKMSFGTGHHETTHLMLKMMLDMSFNSKAVLDMGCGTGVLAILAWMKGATQVVAVDIDPWCHENCLENVERNACSGIEVLKGDLDLIDDRRFDIIIANINRNVLLEHMPGYAGMLNKGGSLLLSGFYSEDIPFIESSCRESGLTLSKKLIRNNWVALKFLN